MKCNEFQSTVMIGVLLTAVMPVPAGGAVGTAFTYQGQLKQDGVPVSGILSMEFSLWNAESGGTMVAPSVVNNNVEVVNGLFTVNLDFGAASFTGEARWLEAAVDGVALAPRHAITAAPYAIHALNAAGGETNWVDDGDNVFLPAGNVGVGTAEPTTMLHLNRPYATTALRFQSLRFDQGAPTSSLRAPGAAANSGNGALWTNPGSALATDDAWARTDLSEIVGTPDADQSAFLDLTAAGFAIPEAGQITGITVQVEGHAEAQCFDCEAGQVSVLAELTGGSTASSQRSIPLGLTDTVFAAGGNVDTWGVDWTPAQINGAGFGVRLSANLAVGDVLCVFGSCGIVPCDCTGVGSGFIDAVSITVFYFDAPTTSSPVHWSLGAAQEDANFRIAPTPDLGSPIVVVTPQGNVGIGTTEFNLGAVKLSVNGAAAKPGGGTWAQLSDARLKRGVEPLTGALERMLSLRGVTFEFTEEGLRTGLATPGRHTGFIAQDVEAVFPEWISGPLGGYKLLSEEGTTALLVEALRELRTEKDAQIAELRERLAAIEASMRGSTGTENPKPE